MIKDKIHTTIRAGALCCLAFSLMETALAEGGRMAARPLTPLEIEHYGLPEGTRTSGGLFTVGIGAPVYLEAQVDAGTVVSGVTWTLESAPTGSTSTLMDSPLGPDIPIYNPGDREVHEVAGRKLLQPDVSGVFNVKAVVEIADSDPLELILDITAATYVGVGTIDGSSPTMPQCALCHDENAAGWMGTGHANFFELAIDGLQSDHYNEGCISCHTVGYDPSTGAVNGGFDDVAAEVEWTFPEVLEPGNWAAMRPELKAVSNIQCENCHGPGNEHGGWIAQNQISVSTSSGDCAQCHDDEPYHVKNIEWNVSRHAVATRYPTGEGRESCVSCHSGIGFIDASDGVPQDQLRTEWEAIVCAACHDPHVAENPHQIRTLEPVTLGNGDVVSVGGNGLLCVNCHKSRRNAEEYAQEYHGHYGPHYGPQGDMIAGLNAIEYGRPIARSAHNYAVPDTCVTCHLQETSSDDPAHGKAGGHTFKMVWDGDTPDDDSDDVDLTGACVDCHGPTDTFNLARSDWDGNGVVEGVQTEIHSLLHRVAVLLPPLDDAAVEVTADYTQPQLKAAYNYFFVEEDGSFGVHNAAYAAGLLQASLSDLTGAPYAGDRDNDCLADSWEIEHFGTIEAQNGNGDPDGDGVINSMEARVQTIPTEMDSDNDGYSDFEELHVGTDPMNAEDSPELGRSMMYHAAEMVFFTETGKTYQVQAVGDLGSPAWENVGEPFEGSGDMAQMFISTRETQMKFYRVVEVE